MRTSYRQIIKGALVALLAPILLPLSVVLTPSVAVAASCGGVTTTIIGCPETGKDNTLEDTAVWGLLTLVISILAGCVGVVSVAAIVYAGIRYASAAGDAAAIAQAHAIFRNVAIGLVCFATIAITINWLVPGGVFGKSRTPLPAPDSSSVTDASSDAPAPTGAGACYNTHVTGPSGRFYHISGGTPYAFEDSLQGVRYAGTHGYGNIDLDLRLTKDGVVVATHDKDPLNRSRDGIHGGFSDPAGTITDKKTLVSSMTYAQVNRLEHKSVNGSGTLHITELQSLLVEAKKQHIMVFLELKTPSLKAYLPQIAAMLNETGVRGYIGIQHQNAGNWSEILSYARRLGFTTRDITLGNGFKQPNKDAALCKQLSEGKP